MRMGISFTADAYEDYTNWAIQDIKIFKKISKLIKEIQRTPF